MSAVDSALCDKRPPRRCQKQRRAQRSTLPHATIHLMRAFFGYLVAACVVCACGSNDDGGPSSGVDASRSDVGTPNDDAPAPTNDAGQDTTQGNDARNDGNGSTDARADSPAPTDSPAPQDTVTGDATTDRRDAVTSDVGSANDGSTGDTAGDRDDGATPVDASGMPDSNTDAPAVSDAPPDTATPPDGSVATVTKSFQQGVDNYAGTKSVGISTYGGLGNVGEWNANGTTFGDGANDWCTGVDIPPSPYSEVWLLRFEDLGIAASAHVVDATLTVYAYGNDTDGNLFLDGRYLAAAWNADVNCAGCSNAAVGWRYRDGVSAPWGGLGATASGTDQVAGKSFRLPESGFVGLGHNPLPYTSQIDAAVVQGWLGGANYGVRILTGVTGVHMGYVQPQRNANARAVTLRPKLTITYEP